MELKDALKLTIEQNGRKVLSDPFMLKAYLNDLAPDHAKDVDMLINASRLHLLDGLARCDESNLSNAKDECIKSASGYFAVPLVEKMEDMLIHALGFQENIFPSPPEYVIENGVLLAYKGKSFFASIPEGVKSIGKGAFKDCPEIQEVIIPASVTEIQEGTFQGYKKLSKVVLPSTLQSIGENAFKGCVSLTDIVLPASLRTIGKDAFRDTGKLDYDRLFGLCAKNEVPLAIADNDLAEEYRNHIKPVPVPPKPKSFNKKLLLLLLIPAAVVVFFVFSNLSSPADPAPAAAPEETAAPAETASTDETAEKDNKEVDAVITQAMEETAGCISDGDYFKAESVLDDLKETRKPATVRADFPIISSYGDSWIGLYKTDGNQYAFYYGDYNDKMEREGSGYYLCTSRKDTGDIKDYRYYYGEWVNDKPNGIQTEYYVRYKGSEKVMDNESTYYTVDGIYDGEFTYYSNLSNQSYTGSFDDGYVVVLGVELDDEEVERKVIAYIDEGKSFYYFSDEKEYTKRQGVAGFN